MEGIDDILNESGVSSGFSPVQVAGGAGSSLGNAGLGLSAGITALAANPVTGLALGVGSLLFKGVNYWLQSRKADRDRKKAEKRYDDEMAERKRQWEAEFAQQQERTKLTKTQLLANLRQQQVENERYIESTNQTRKDDWYAGFMQQINKPDNANKLLQIYGGGR